MNKKENISRLRVYASSTDKIDNRPVYETLVYEAKKQDLAGATVLRGVMGYGASSIVHTSKLWELTEKLPVIVEIIDEKEKILKYYGIIEQRLKNMSKGCLVTIEQVNVLLYKEGKKK